MKGLSTLGWGVDVEIVDGIVSDLGIFEHTAHGDLRVSRGPLEERHFVFFIASLLARRSYFAVWLSVDV